MYLDFFVCVSAVLRSVDGNSSLGNERRVLPSGEVGGALLMAEAAPQCRACVPRALGFQAPENCCSKRKASRGEAG